MSYLVYPYTDKLLHRANCQMDIAKTDATSPLENAVETAVAADNCLESAAKCLHCGGPLRVKDKTCPVQVEEQAILDIWNKHKVGKWWARHMYEGNDARDVIKNKNAFATKFICKIDKVMKRKLTSWALEKCFHRELEAKPSSIRCGGWLISLWMSQKKAAVDSSLKSKQLITF